MAKSVASTVFIGRRSSILSPTCRATAMQAAAREWKHAYSRELAVFPLATLKQQKYWPPVARVDNVYGDKNVFCSCIPVDAFKEEGEPEAFSEPMAV